MTSEAPGNAAEDPGFFDGRFLIRINAWDWPLSVGLSSDPVPPEHRFQGGLRYTRTFDIDGEVAAPKEHRGRPVRVWVSPFSKDLRFGPENYPEVGRFFLRHPEKGQKGLSMTILLPEDAITTTATCLASVWKYLHVWTVAADTEQARIKSYSFSADFHPNLEGWVNGD
jgi:hypothetical protein